MNEIKIFEFYGTGSFSEKLDFDSGLDVTILNETSLVKAQSNEKDHLDKHHIGWNKKLPENLKPGVYDSYLNDDGGERVVSGWIIAKNIEQAHLLGMTYSSLYYITELDEAKEIEQYA
jgi:hypothetical protein